MTPLKLAVLGAAGRMGRTVIRLIAEDPALALTGAVEPKGSKALGEDAGTLAGAGPLGVAVMDDPAVALRGAQGLIDFTAPKGTLSALAHTRALKTFHIIGTTGFSGAEEQTIAEAARETAIVKAGNFSLGVNLLCLLTEEAARALGAGFDVEILEMHHRHKEDAPSGTALMLGEAAAKGRNARLTDLRRPMREGRPGARPEGSIGFASLRGGSVVGEHSVVFAGPSERLVLSHMAEDRTLFAQGALAAAHWAATAKPGLYGMPDVLGAS